MRKSIVKFEDVKDQVFNYLKVIEEDIPYFNGKYNQRRWIFECICGNKKSLLPSTPESLSMLYLIPFSKPEGFPKG